MNEKRSFRGWLACFGKRVWQAYLLAAALTAAATLLGFCGRLWWLLDLFSHFRVQYTIILMPAVVGPLAQRRLRWFAVALVPFLANVVLIAPLYFGQDAAAEDSAGLRILIANVFTANTQTERFLNLVRETDADLVLVMEVNERWASEIAEIETTYPHSLVVPREDNFGIALYSRLPFEKQEVINVSRRGIPSLVAEVRVGERPLTVIGTHPLPPVSGTYATERDRQLRAVAEYAQDVEGPCIVAGDFNATSWSAVFRDVVRISGLRDSRGGFGVQPSWTTRMPPAMIPIDHCLVSDDVRVHDRKIGPDIGSDHLPVIVDLSIGQ